MDRGLLQGRTGKDTMAMMTSLQRILSATMTLLLVTTAAGAAQAALGPQGISDQGASPQGASPQGASPQGASPQGVGALGVRLEGVTLSSAIWANGDAVDSPQLQGSTLWGYQWSPYGWVHLGGDAFVGGSLEGDLVVEGDPTATPQHVILFIDEVVADTATNTMVCDPQNPSQTTCSRKYNRNTDVTLYKMMYLIEEPGEPIAGGWLCGGDHMAMLFRGEWGEDGAWIDDPTKITVSCTSGVLTKCARSWGYKPWRTMIDKEGNARDMRAFHQACTRAARADYAGAGQSFTVTGTMIDLCDNAGFNVPASSSELTSLGYQPWERFESLFTSQKQPGAIKQDYWAAWLAQMRYDNLPLWVRAYSQLDWDGESPDTSTSPPSRVHWLDFLYGRYSPRGVEMAVYNPIWSETGPAVATGDTVDSFNHYTPSCAPTSGAPDRAYRWTAPASGVYEITTDGSSFDTVLSIISATEQEEIVCDDDSGEGPRSAVTVPASAGEELTIFIDGKGTEAGPYTLNIQKL
jgi:hypothetical protein